MIRVELTSTAAMTIKTEEPANGNDYESWFRQQVLLGIEEADAGQLLTAEEVDALAEARIARAIAGMDED